MRDFLPDRYHSLRRGDVSHLYVGSWEQGRRR